MKRLSALVLACALSGCIKSTPTEEVRAEEPAPNAGKSQVVDSCASNGQIAVDFLNLYVRHLNANESSANPTDTYEWLKKSSLVDGSVASSYATVDLVDGDPILSAQDYPNKFEFAGCPAPGIVKVQGAGDFNVLVKVAPVDDGVKVVGVGSINMSEDSAGSEASAQVVNAVGESSKPASGGVGADVDCVAGLDGVADLGSSFNDGVFLCREHVDGPYWNDWYAVVGEGRPSTYRVIAEGKTMFEGLLTVNCSGEKTNWDTVKGFEHSEASSTVPADAVDNVIQIACRM